MTGILRIRGFDTTTNQKYILLAADTQVTGCKDGFLFKLKDSDKIFSSQNYLIANRGFSLTENKGLIGSKVLESLIFSEKINVRSINSLIRDINLLHDCNTNFFVVDKNNLKFYELGNKNEIIYGDSWATTGKGAPYIEKVLSLLPKKKFIQMPMIEVLQYAYKAIDYAAKYNDVTFTGGFFSFGAVGEKEVKLKLNLKKLCQ